MKILFLISLICSYILANDDPLLMSEPDINALEINSTAIKKSSVVQVTEEKTITIKNTKELDVLETYMTEIIATFAILILIVIYFLIKKSKQKEKDIFEGGSSVLESQEKEKAKRQLKRAVKKDEELAKQQETMLMQESTETINLDVLNGDEEGSFEEEEKIVEEITEAVEENTEQKIVRKKRDVPPHDKITKENFKEFAGLKILIAEDNLINQKVLTGLLADSGIELILADDGQIVLDILKEDSKYDFILMDVHMPRMDGFESTREIRKNPEYDHIVIIALSGDIASDDIKKMYDAGMEEHLEKPLKMELLYNTLYTYSEDALNCLNVEEDIDIALDVESGLNICGDDETFYKEILTEFVATYSNSPSRVQEFLNTNNMQEARLYFLDLSGVSANIGAEKLSKIALKLKKASENPKDGEYVKLYKNYTESLEDLLADIQNYMA